MLTIPTFYPTTSHLVKCNERLQELHITEHLLGGSPEVFNLLAGATGVRDTVRLDPLDHTHSLQHQSKTV